MTRFYVIDGDRQMSDIELKIEQLKKEIFAERDLLEGNLNRMSVADSKEELDDMTVWAIRRVVNIQRLKNTILELRAKEDIK